MTFLSYKKTIGLKLAGQFSVVLLLTLVVFFVAIVQIGDIRQVSHTISLIGDLQAAADHLDNQAHILGKNALSENTANIAQGISDFNRQAEEASRVIQRLVTEGKAVSHDSLHVTASTLDQYKRRFNATANTLSQKHSGTPDIADAQLEISRLSHALDLRVASLLSAAEHSLQARIDQAILLTIITLVIVLAAGVALSVIFSKRQAKKIDAMNTCLAALSSGQVPEKLEVKSNDEISVSAKAINDLIDRIQTAATFANRIGQGELSLTYDDTFNNDLLAHALQNMHKQLKTTADESAKRNWATTGLAEFGHLLRTDVADLSALGNNIITKLVKYLKANQGQLFIVSGNNENDRHLELVATYAWSKKKFVTKKIYPGDGLAGQAWIEKNTIYLKDIPQDYVKITSGLGEALPNCVVIVPLKLNDVIFGVVEIASFHLFSPHEVEFVEKLAEMLASTLSTVRINERTKDLLEQSQHQAEELRAQEEEMRQNMEELTATQEEMARKDIEMSGQLAAIDNSMATIEFTMDGRIVTANQKFLQVSGYALDEIRGKHHRIFLEDDYASSVEYIKFWKDLNAGIAQSGEFKRKTKDGKDVWISASYTVVMNTLNRPMKVIKFALDITAQKLKSLDFEGQINAVNNTMASIEFDLNGRIVHANEKFLKAMGYALADIRGAHHSMFVDPVHAQSNAYSTFWNDLRAGKPQTGEFKRFGRNQKEVWISASYTPITDAAGKVYKIIKFAQDITLEKLRAVDFEGQISAIRKSNAVIEFDMTGKILFTNDLFLVAMGYSSPKELIDHHHSVFVPELERESSDYRRFWERLRRGEYFSGEFKRQKADGSSVWIYGSYNPILDPDGKPYKVVKYAHVVDKNEVESFLAM